MRFIVYNDIHYSNQLKGITLRDFIDIDKMVAEEAKKVPGTKVLFLGDRFLSRSPHYLELMASEEGISYFDNIDYYALVGNHDQLHKRVGSEHTLMHWSKDKYKNIKVLDRPGWFLFEDLEIFSIPAGGFPEVPDIQNTKNDKIKICLFHDIYANSIVHASGKRIEGTINSLIDKDFFAFVLGGDNHVMQELPFKNTKGWHTGAPLSHNFGDKGQDRGFWEFIVDDDTKKLTSYRFINSGKPSFVEIDLEIDSIEDFKEKIKEEDMNGNSVRLTVSCKKDDSLLKSEIESFIHEEFKTRFLQTIMKFTSDKKEVKIVEGVKKKSLSSRFDSYLFLRGVDNREILIDTLRKFLC